jgi:hypothetical protein
MRKAQRREKLLREEEEKNEHRRANDDEALRGAPHFLPASSEADGLHHGLNKTLNKGWAEGRTNE